MERNKTMRREDNFQELVKNKKIIIPIIQRDYAQGRNSPKAISVRTRLIDEWIDILKDPNLRMDFNYIYGNEMGDVFYPVDGQQRLTSLYLLHWYLAMATDNTDKINEWQFDYNTRNSASEFFGFLRDADKSMALFKILHPDKSDKTESEKQASVKNESWFKTKWENDPTVVSCLNFLCLLSGKLFNYEGQLDAFWERLNDASCSAVYFTCLNECNDEDAEIDAAKKYIRMNARGKRLTNFENLKAMVDEIEMKYIKDLEYCSTDEHNALSDTISWSYDRTYIDCLFNSSKKSALIEKTKEINDISEKWFRLVYYVYALLNKYKIPCDLGLNSEINSESYLDVIYKISQERKVDKKIAEYLFMLKSVFEVLCNSNDVLAYEYDNFKISDKNSRFHAIAFVLFVWKLWDKNNSEEDNANIVSKWEQFKSAIDNLRFQEWRVSNEEELADILSKMIDGIVGTCNISVDEFFVNTNFETGAPFNSFGLLDDLKCRIIERKIKSKLILDGAVCEKDIDKVPIGNWRWGYLYYICEYLSDWKLDDWSNKPKWDGEKIKSYINLIKGKKEFEVLMRSREAKVVFAYASQCDTNSNCLLNASDINSCNNEHIWNHDYLEWDDDEYDEIADEKMKMLNHLKVMFDLLLRFRASSGASEEGLIEMFVENINTYFETNAGYEECWIRFATKFTVGGKNLLDSELENENGIVTLKSVPVIIRTYLIENGYTYIDKIFKLKDFKKKSNYFTADENKIQFASTDITFTFAPDVDNSGKYQHSKKTSWGWDLSGNAVNRNMDLSYRAYVNLSGIGKSIKNNFWTVDIKNGEYTIKVFEIIGTNNGKLVISISEAQIDANVISCMDANISQWKIRFESLEKEPKKTGNYDHWIELWNNDYASAFGPSFVQGAVTYDKNGGQRPRKVWSEVVSVPALTWSVSMVEI